MEAYLAEYGPGRNPWGSTTDTGSGLKREFLARPESFPDHKGAGTAPLLCANPPGDTNPLAHDHDRGVSGSLSGVLDAAPEELEKVKGVGEYAAVLLKCVKELSGRYLTSGPVWTWDRGGHADGLRPAAALLLQGQE